MDRQNTETRQALWFNTPCDTLVRVGFAALVLFTAGKSSVLAAGDRSATIDTGNVELSLGIEGLLEGGESLNLRLVTALGAVRRVTPESPAELKVNANGTVEGRNLRVILKSPGRRGGALNLELSLDGTSVSGAYAGTWNRAEVNGAVSGTAVPGKGILDGDPKPPLELVKASYFGTAGDDNFEGAVAGPDGCLYLVGNAGTVVEELPGGVKPVTFGSQSTSRFAVAVSC